MDDIRHGDIRYDTVTYDTVSYDRDTGSHGTVRHGGTIYDRVWLDIALLAAVSVREGVGVVTLRCR